MRLHRRHQKFLGYDEFAPGSALPVLFASQGLAGGFWQLDAAAERF